MEKNKKAALETPQNMVIRSKTLGDYPSLIKMTCRAGLQPSSDL